MVTVFGLGFVGLTTALGFAEMGYKVYGIEHGRERMDMIKAGRLPFLEPGLDDALARHLNKLFVPTDDIAMAIACSDFVYYCVGTPYGNNGQADLTHLFKALDQTIDAVRDEKFRVLVVKSTIPPSTTRERVIPYLRNKGVGEMLGVANNPEFLREGHCWEDFICADRIVLGTCDARSQKMLEKLYEKAKCPVFCVSLNTSEFIKYLSNTLLATLISYANEMSIAADSIGDIHISEAFKILHLDRRWGGCDMTSYVYPGCGYGGYCLPKDTNAFYALTKSFGFDPKILKSVIDINDRMPEFMVNKTEQVAKYDKSVRIGVLGLSFKPGSDDTRDASSAKIIRQLIARGYKNIMAYDPIANNEFAKYYDFDILYMDSYNGTLKNADLLIIATAWDEFRNIREMTDKPVVDCRYML